MVNQYLLKGIKILLYPAVVQKIPENGGNSNRSSNSFSLLSIFGIYSLKFQVYLSMFVLTEKYFSCLARPLIQYKTIQVRILL